MTIYDNIPYLETEEEAAENIADIYEQKDNKARTFAPKHNVKKDMILMILMILILKILI